MEQKNWNLLDEALGLNNNNAKPWPLCGRFVLVEDCVDTSAAFVLHQILKRSFSSHPSSAVVFLAFSHPFSHYDRVLRKLGCNLAAQRDNGRLFFLDMLMLQCPDEGKANHDGLASVFEQIVKIGVASTVPIRSMSTSTISSAITSETAAEDQVQRVNLLRSTDDNYDGVIVELDQPMDSTTFISILRASVSHWKKLGKKGVWIKLPIHLVNLVEALVKEGFWYHHAEPKYLMLVYWIPESPSTIPANATHRVGIGSFVMNEKQEVLVVQENSGLFQGTGVWKFPTGVVDQGEDICVAAVREVKEETGVDSEFVEVLSFRQSHNSFFEKSDLFFVCMLRPLSSDIKTQRLEILNAQWMPFEEYAAQPFIQKSELLKYINDTCLAKMGGQYSGFSSVPTSSNFSDQKNYLYLSAGALKSSYSS